MGGERDRQGDNDLFQNEINRGDKVQGTSDKENLLKQGQGTRDKLSKGLISIFEFFAESAWAEGQGSIKSLRGWAKLWRKTAELLKKGIRNL